MNTKDKLEELKAISDAKTSASTAARKTYDAARDACFGGSCSGKSCMTDFAVCEITNAARDAYKTAVKDESAAWDAYISKKNETTVKENKMNAENKMSELKIAAWEAHSAEVDAAASRDAAWEVYIDAIDAFNAAHASAEKAAKTANDYESSDYEALDYDPAG